MSFTLMLYWLHHYLPQPILFEFGFFRIYWYGLFIVLGIIAGLIIVLKLAKRKGILSDEVYNLGFYLIIFSLIGARLYSVFLDFPYYRQFPLEIFAVWQGGLAIHGVLIAGILTLIFYTRLYNQSFWQWADLIAPALALGQAIGRFGNYFNQELFGRPTDLPWGIPIALANRPVDYLADQYFHPTFLYESGLNLVNFFILLFLFFKLPVFSFKLKGGIIFLIYLINYSLIRMTMEFFRIDQVPIIFGWRLPIVVSSLIIVISLVVIIIKTLVLSAKSQTSNPQ